jgi:gas vesicle protein
MALSKNKKVIEANKHRGTKIQLEAFFIRRLTALFNKIATELVKELKQGKTLVASQFQNEFFNLLKKQYERINKKINTKYINADIEGTKRINDKSFLDFVSLMLSQVSNRILYILATTQKEINTSISKLQESENPENIDSLKNIFLAASLYRASLIAISETQNAFELKKSVLSDNVLLLERHKLQKTWITILDGRERPWHGEAFGQTVENTQLFSVNNEFLKYPGDVSHGATPSNICNCRCTAIYTNGQIIGGLRAELIT